MKDQPVPNPLASNQNFNTHKVFAAIGLILIAAIIIVGGVWWYVESQDKASATDDETPVKVTTTSAKPASASDSSPKLSVDDGFSFRFSVELPNGWVSRKCDTNDPIFFAPTTDLLGLCNSGYGGLISTFERKSGFVCNSSETSAFKNPEVVNKTVSGKDACRISGIRFVEDGLTEQNGYIYINYLIEVTEETSLQFTYLQDPTSVDYSEDFDVLVSSVKIDDI